MSTVACTTDLNTNRNRCIDKICIFFFIGKRHTITVTLNIVVFKMNILACMNSHFIKLLNKYTGLYFSQHEHKTTNQYKDLCYFHNKN